MHDDEGDGLPMGGRDGGDEQLMGGRGEEELRLGDPASESISVGALPLPCESRSTNSLLGCGNLDLGRNKCSNKGAVGSSNACGDGSSSPEEEGGGKGRILWGHAQSEERRALGEEGGREPLPPETRQRQEDARGGGSSGGSPRDCARPDRVGGVVAIPRSYARAQGRNVGGEVPHARTSSVGGVIARAQGRRRDPPLAQVGDDRKGSGGSCRAHGEERRRWQWGHLVAMKTGARMAAA